MMKRLMGVRRGGWALENCLKLMELRSDNWSHSPPPLDSTTVQCPFNIFNHCTTLHYIGVYRSAASICIENWPVPKSQTTNWKYSWFVHIDLYWDTLERPIDELWWNHLPSTFKKYKSKYSSQILIFEKYQTNRNQLITSRVNISFGIFQRHQSLLQQRNRSHSTPLGN